ncbi:MAG TPA: SDR family NAD(P)-dependent oxidoreductase [Dehalococcoidia bacterium]|jgi:NAD(P)-dependent dehydrogenase (short-subunit alcohol dehydrogenase family)|nr:SDR family oxidoreductase [Chloroflexota bacterium]MDP5876310.1 SDR family NAD(P)-dependent oxidoreductase [Dehalococcoidia bacterium]MDP6272804.1 SDR family NAD(P)-dependent oxidoreductase [Dehalococcoidia bacterium]MDP7160557.1 SDR family NAD(P)-dependent oxidoreductase [Dehalococcoidia bacterium]MDP7212590.1 SDR family NAD(P)-dependent oxidoreductase [Dehalococcoidia bacterium]|tara:strand:- start:10998 stop:11831 length:834 start_codon:yes stop_codon:yes gene_type:complete
MTDATNLDGAVTLITGAGRGIGLGIAEVLSERGAVIAVSDLDPDSATVAANAFNAGGAQAVPFGGDTTSQESMDALAAAVIEEFGHIDILVCNAGVIGAPGYQERSDHTEADWDATFGVNVKGFVHTTNSVAPHMRSRNAGRIVNIASHGGRKPRGARSTLGSVQTPYSVSKAAVIQWTHLLAIELAQHNITVNAVCPGVLWTPMWETIAENQKSNNPELAELTPREVFDQSIKARMPMGREQTPRDIGKAVAFLASDDASEITGQALNVNGGAVMN